MSGPEKGKSGTAATIVATEIPVLHNCYAITDLYFAFDKSYLRPAQGLGLEPEVKKLRGSGPSAAVLNVFGHTDNVAPTTIYNKHLSDRRAWSVFSLLICDPDAWVHLHIHEHWGVLEVQETILALQQRSAPGGAPAAVLPIDLYIGADGKQPRVENLRGLYEEYMKLCVTKPLDAQNDFAHPTPWVGCSDFNPIVPASTSMNKAVRDSENEPNRRVVLLLMDPKPPCPCLVDSLKPCARFRFAKGSPAASSLFKCEFYHRMIAGGTCSSESNPPTPRSPASTPSKPTKEVHVYLGFPGTSIFPSVIEPNQANRDFLTYFFPKSLEEAEINAGGHVVAVIEDEVKDTEEERELTKRASKASPLSPTALVKLDLWCANQMYYLRARVVLVDTGEELFNATVNAPRIVGWEGYYKRTGKYVWRLVTERKPSPGSEMMHLDGVGLNHYRNDLSLLLRIDMGGVRSKRWKEYPSVTDRVKDILLSRSQHP